jgi:hypothetical protein
MPGVAVPVPLHRALAVLAAVLLVSTATVVALVHAGPLGTVPLAYAFPAIAVLYAAAGLVAWWRRPANALGALLVCGGVALLSASLANTGVPVLIAAGTVTAVLPVSVLLHLLIACPSGRVVGAAARAAVAAAYVTGLVLQAPLYLFRPADPPYDLVVLADRPGLALAGERVQNVAGALVVAVTVWLLVRRLREYGPRQRWALAPLFGFGVLAVVAVPVVANVLRPLLGLGPEATAGLQLIAFATVPLGFLGVVLRGGFARTGELNAFVTSLLSSSGSSRDLEDAVAATLGDPSAALLRWSPAADGYVDADERPTALPEDGRAVLRLAIGDRRVGAVVYDPRLGTDPAAVAAVGRVTAIAMDREQLADEVLASRAALRQARRACSGTPTASGAASRATCTTACRSPWCGSPCRWGAWRRNRRGPRSVRCSPASPRRSTRPPRRCARSCTASCRRRWSSAGWPPPCRSSPTTCRSGPGSTSTACRSGCPRRSRAPRTSSWPRR